MSKSKSKLGHNPLQTRGVGAFFTEASPDESAPGADIVETANKQAAKSATTTNLESVKTVSRLVNIVTNPSDQDAELERHTFYLTKAQAQKVKLYALLHGTQISAVVRMLIDEQLKIQP